MVTLEQIHLKLAEAIKNSGYSQTQLAKLLGVTQQTISQYLNGHIFPALDTLANLCKILDISADYILCIEN